MALAVALGAFGTHALKDVLDAKQLDWWGKAQTYQVWHSLALLAVGMLERAGARTGASGWMFLVGTVVFSGTLYGMALRGPLWLGAITPLGGASLILGWLTLAWKLAKERRTTGEIE